MINPSRLAATALTAGMLTVLSPAQSAPAAGPSFTVTTLHFEVSVGPKGATQTCDIVGDVYRPASATKKHRAPAVLTTNGFGGSKNDQRGMARLLAGRGYVVLSYSGLGFGGSGCKITLDDPRYDGRAASQLISYLGGASGIAFHDAAHQRPAPPLNVVALDRKRDPRVGMVGGSYGGGVQFAAASVDRRLDTIIPLITWNDLSYSLGPNAATQTSGVSTRTPGAVKLFWGVGFAAFGVVSGLQNIQADPVRLLVCPNFPTFICAALVTAGVSGSFRPSSVAALRKASVASYVRKVRVPVLLMQGQKDTLFNLNEAAATYRSLRKQGTPVKMAWVSWGHSGPPAPGEYDASRPDPAGTPTGPDRRLVRPLPQGQGRQHRPAVLLLPRLGPLLRHLHAGVRHLGHFPVGTRTTWRLSGGGALVTGAARPGKQRS